MMGSLLGSLLKLRFENHCPPELSRESLPLLVVNQRFIPMRQLIKEWVSIAATSLPIVGPIYEFGSLQVLGQEGFADLRTLFPNKQYVGCDMREGPGVDKIIDLHDIDLPDESVGTALSLDTLEHVEYPYKAMDEIYRIILPDGIAVISSVMQFPIHDYPYDYWRFTPEAFKSLLKPFRHSFVGFAGDKDFPHTVLGIGFKGDNSSLPELLIKYARWQKRQARSVEHVVRSLTPPLLLPFVSRVGRAILGTK